MARAAAPAGGTPINLLAGIISGPDSHGHFVEARKPADLSALLSFTRCGRGESNTATCKWRTEVDRTSKLIFAAIALGLFLNVAVKGIAPASAEHDYTSYLSQIASNTSSAASRLAQIESNTSAIASNTRR